VKCTFFTDSYEFFCGYDVIVSYDVTEHYIFPASTKETWVIYHRG